MYEPYKRVNTDEMRKPTNTVFRLECSVENRDAITPQAPTRQQVHQNAVIVLFIFQQCVA
jgi:hypothetical protein